jgi:pyruvate/2-oxoglutarate/acetoin dehydrogenase E1 component
VAAEIAATIGELAFGLLAAPIRRFTLPDVPAPTSPVLEQAYYPNASQLVRMAQDLLGRPGISR